jgi:hypothetical protein
MSSDLLGELLVIAVAALIGAWYFRRGKRRG